MPIIRRGQAMLQLTPANLQFVAKTTTAVRAKLQWPH
jgi:hypothetical protein